MRVRVVSPCNAPPLLLADWSCPSPCSTVPRATRSQQWVRESRADENGGKVAPAPPQAPTPLTREYWAAQTKRRIGEIASSHTVKYPYSFYALAKDVTDEDLKKRILAKVHALTAAT